MPEHKSTFLEILINENPKTITLTDNIENASLLKLKYFKLSDWSPVDPVPRYLFLEINGLTSNSHVICSSNTMLNHPTAQPPNPARMFLYTRPDPPLFDNIIPGLPISYPVIHGKQDDIGFVIEDHIKNLQKFTITIYDATGRPFLFDTNTLAFFKFKVEFEGKRNLDPYTYSQKYSSLQN